MRAAIAIAAACACAESPVSTEALAGDECLPTIDRIGPPPHVTGECPGTEHPYGSARWVDPNAPIIAYPSGEVVARPYEVRFGRSTDIRIRGILSGTYQDLQGAELPVDGAVVLEVNQVRTSVHKQTPYNTLAGNFAVRGVRFHNGLYLPIPIVLPHHSGTYFLRDGAFTEVIASDGGVNAAGWTVGTFGDEYAFMVHRSTPPIAQDQLVTWLDNVELGVRYELQLYQQSPLPATTPPCTIAVWRQNGFCPVEEYPSSDHALVMLQRALTLYGTESSTFGVPGNYRPTRARFPNGLYADVTWSSTYSNAAYTPQTITLKTASGTVLEVLTFHYGGSIAPRLVDVTSSADPARSMFFEYTTHADSVWLAKAFAGARGAPRGVELAYQRIEVDDGNGTMQCATERAQIVSAVTTIGGDPLVRYGFDRRPATPQPGWPAMTYYREVYETGAPEPLDLALIDRPLGEPPVPCPQSLRRPGQGAPSVFICDGLVAPDFRPICGTERCGSAVTDVTADAASVRVVRLANGVLAATPTRVTTNDGELVTFLYDDATGDLRSMTGDGGTTTYDYTATGGQRLVTEVRIGHPNGRLDKLELDAQARPFRTITNAGPDELRTEWHYASTGSARLDRVVDPQGVTTQLAYRSATDDRIDWRERRYPIGPGSPLMRRVERDTYVYRSDAYIESVARVDSMLSENQTRASSLVFDHVGATPLRQRTRMLASGEQLVLSETAWDTALRRPIDVFGAGGAASLDRTHITYYAPSDALAGLPRHVDHNGGVAARGWRESFQAYDDLGPSHTERREWASESEVSIVTDQLERDAQLNPRVLALASPDGLDRRSVLGWSGGRLTTRETFDHGIRTSHEVYHLVPGSSRLASVTNAVTGIDQVFGYELSPAHRLVRSATQQSGNVLEETTYGQLDVFDRARTVQRTTRGLGRTTEERDYDRYGHVERVTVDGVATRRFYDTIGRLARDEAPLATTTYAYAIAGLREQVTATAVFDTGVPGIPPQVATSTIDGFGRVRARHDGATGAHDELVYHATHGWLERVTTTVPGAAPEVIVLGHDAQGRTSSWTRNDVAERSVDYTGAGRVLRELDARLSFHEYDYRAGGFELQSVRRPDTFGIVYFHRAVRADGGETRYTQHPGHAVEEDYSPRGELESRRTIDGTEIVTQTFDRDLGDLEAIAFASNRGTSSTMQLLDRDAFGRPRRHTTSTMSPSGSLSQTLQMSFTPRGDLASMTYPSGRVASYQRDPATGRLASVSVNGAERLRRVYDGAFLVEEIGAARHRTIAYEHPALPIPTGFVDRRPTGQIIGEQNIGWTSRLEIASVTDLTGTGCSQSYLHGVYGIDRYERTCADGTLHEYDKPSPGPDDVFGAAPPVNALYQSEALVYDDDGHVQRDAGGQRQYALDAGGSLATFTLPGSARGTAMHDPLGATVATGVDLGARGQQQTRVLWGPDRRPVVVEVLRSGTTGPALARTVTELVLDPDTGDVIAIEVDDSTRGHVQLDVGTGPLGEIEQLLERDGLEHTVLIESPYQLGRRRFDPELDFAFALAADPRLVVPAGAADELFVGASGEGDNRAFDAGGTAALLAPRGGGAFNQYASQPSFGQSVRDGFATYLEARRIAEESLAYGTGEALESIARGFVNLGCGLWDAGVACFASDDASIGVDGVYSGPAYIDPDRISRALDLLPREPIGLNAYGLTPTQQAFEGAMAAATFLPGGPLGGGRPFNPNQRALIALVKEQTRGYRVPLSRENAALAIRWAREYKVPVRSKWFESKMPDRWVAGRHFHLNTKHVPVAPRQWPPNCGDKVCDVLGVSRVPRDSIGRTGWDDLVTHLEANGFRLGPPTTSLRPGTTAHDAFLVQWKAAPNRLSGHGAVINGGWDAPAHLMSEQAKGAMSTEPIFYELFFPH